MGRRSGLTSSAADRIVQRWIDDAVEQLAGMRYTCALDVAEQYPDELTEASIRLVLGVSEQAIGAELKGLTSRLKVPMSLASGH